MSLLLRFFRHYTHGLWNKLMLQAMQHAGSIMAVMLFGHLVTLLSSAEATLLQICACVGMIAILEGTSLFCQYGFNISLLRGVARSTRILKEEALERLMQQDTQVRENTHQGEWERRICGDTQIVASCAYPALWDIIGTLLAFVLVSGVLIYEHPTFLLLIIVLMMAFCGVYRLNAKHLTHAAHDAREMSYCEGTSLLDFLALTPIMSLFRATQRMFTRFSDSARQVERSNVAIGKRSHVYTTHIRSVMQLGYIACLAISVLMNRQGLMGVGELVANMMLIGQLSGQMGQLVFTIPSLNRGAESARALHQAFGLLGKERTSPHQKDFTTTIIPPKNAPLLRIRNVSFRYQNGPSILKKLNWEVGTHEYHSILGRNGAGKSTLIKLLLGTLQGEEGRIVRHFSRPGYVPQATAIFQGSLRDNITLCRPDVEEHELSYLLQLCRLEQLVERLGGWESLVSREQLSGGEIQRIGIARALFMKPDLLVIDEITNNLDIENKALVFDTLRELRNHCSIISISHDMESLADSDESWMLQQGTLLRLEGTTPAEKRQHAFQLIKNNYHE